MLKMCKLKKLYINNDAPYIVLQSTKEAKPTEVHMNVFV